MNNKFNIGDEVRNTSDPSRAGSIKSIVEKCYNDKPSYSYLIYNESSKKYFLESEGSVKLVKEAPEDSEEIKSTRAILESYNPKSDLKIGDIVSFSSKLPIFDYAVAAIYETTHGEDMWQYDLINITNTDESCIAGRLILKHQYHDKKWEEYVESIKGRSDIWDAFIPMNVDEDQFFREMAEIYPGYNQDYNIKRNRFKVSVVQGGEGPVPHVHVYYEKKGSKQDVAYICLGRSEYAPQHVKETKILNSQEKKDLIKFFNTFRKGAFTLDKSGNPVPCNCWQECVDIWMESYRPEDPSKYFNIDEETGMYIIPDY